MIGLQNLWRQVRSYHGMHRAWMVLDGAGADPVWSKNPICMKSKEDSGIGPVTSDWGVTLRYIALPDHIEIAVFAIREHVSELVIPASRLAGSGWARGLNRRAVGSPPKPYPPHALE
jgi:hypothetical protein